MESSESTPERSAATDAGAADCAPPVSNDHHITPPYWKTHFRTESNLSAASIRLHRSRIALEDHTEEQCEQSKALWARHVSIKDYTIISGAAPGIGAYVVWNCTVETLDGGPMKVRKRYSEFDQLRRDLARTFPHAESSMPRLPRKSMISRFQPKFLEHRRVGLLYFLNCVLLNPEFAGSAIVKDFLFS